MIWGLMACTPHSGPVFFGAASTERPALQVLGDDVRTSFASSTLLAHQIRAGAGADLFLSADPAVVEGLGERTELLGNRLVLAGHGELGDAPCVAVGDPETVPLGRYTVQAIDLDVPTLPAESASATARLVRSGQCPLGVLYATDAGDLPIVQELEGPEIVYPAVVTGPHGEDLLAQLRANLQPFADAGFTLL